MRRMNSRLLGHHGASARTDALVALDRELGLAGRPTRAAGARSATGSRSGRAAAAPLSASTTVASSASSATIRGSKRTCSERMPGASSAMPSIAASRQRLVQRVRADPQVEVEHVRPELDEHVLVAGAPDRQRGTIGVGGIDVQHRALGRRRRRARRRAAVGCVAPRVAISCSCRSAQRERVGVGDRAEAARGRRRAAGRASSGRPRRPSPGTRTRRGSGRRGRG